MATIKSYTDLEQSKKLAEILPLESADYTHLGKDEDNVLTRSYFESCSSELKEWIGKDEMAPCWSLASLLGVLPDELEDNHFLTLQKEKNEYCCCYEDINGNSFRHTFADNPVDACVAIIERLHELNLL